MKRKSFMCLILCLWVLLLLIGLYFDASIFFVSFTVSWLFVFVMADFGLISFLSLFISAVVVMKLWAAVYRGLGRDKRSFVLTLAYFLGSWFNYLLIYCSKSVYDVWGWMELLNIVAGITVSLVILGGAFACSRGVSRVGYIAVEGGEKNRYVPDKRYKLLRKGKAVANA